MMKGHLSRKMAAMTAFSLFCWAFATLAAPAGAAAPQVRFEHWLNVSERWHTGAINQINSDYVEGDVVPHRIVFENFEGDVTFAFSYEYEDPAIPAFGHDYLADVNATESSTLAGGLTTDGVFRYEGMTGVAITGPTLSDHGDRVDHYYVVTATFSGDDAYFYYGAHLAVDGDYVDHLGASSWHGGNLENRFDEDGAGGPRGDRTLSMKVESEIPVHPEKGRIVVVKTVPGDFDEEFEFSPSYGKSFALADGESNDSGPLSAGSYTLEEVLPLDEGWHFHGATCAGSSSDGDSRWWINGAMVEISLAGGETVTCTFENRSEEGPTRGSITVIKTTNPATDLEFPFRISTGADSRLFVLRGVDDPTTSGAIENRVVFGELPEGEYVVQETGSSALPGGYTFYSVTCEGGTSQYDGALAIIDLDPGDAIVCTFDNRRSTTPPTPFTPSSESGEIRIVKKAAGTERFSFEASWLPSGFTLAGGETRSSGSLAPGVYWVNEAMSALQQSDGWRFARAACSDGSPINAIQLGGGEVVTCTFENAQVKAEVVVATTASTTAAVVAEVVVETLPFTGTNAVGLSMIALFVMALGALVVLAATPIRQD